jgi:hypothetical protein
MKEVLMKVRPKVGWKPAGNFDSKLLCRRFGSWRCEGNLESNGFTDNDELVQRKTVSGLARGHEQGFIDKILSPQLGFDTSISQT